MLVLSFTIWSYWSEVYQTNTLAREF